MSTAPLPSWEDYFIPGTQVLRNKFGVSDAAALMRREEAVTKIRAAELAAHPIRGTFDHDHLKAVHRHLFQDVYPWAGF